MFSFFSKKNKICSLLPIHFRNWAVGIGPGFGYRGFEAVLAEKMFANSGNVPTQQVFDDQ